MKKSIVIVKVEEFPQGAMDRNGEYPVRLKVILGIAPNKNILSGTKAKNMGFELGKLYAVQIEYVGEDDKYGSQFKWEPLLKLDLSDPVLLSSEEYLKLDLNYGKK